MQNWFSNKNNNGRTLAKISQSSYHNIDIKCTSQDFNNFCFLGEKEYRDSLLILHSM
jgi:hypothetical protein